MHANGEVEDVHELRLLLVGKTGVGTSSAGNTILGRNVFPSATSFSSITDKYQKQSSTFANRTVTVVDCPNFFHSTLSKKDFRVEIEKGVKCCSFGLHALLFVFTPDTFTEQEADIVSLFKHTFGEEAVRYAIVLFTHGDDLHDYTMEEMIRKNRRLSNLVDECGGRYHILNDKGSANRQQVTELVEKIDRMVAANGNSCYTLEMFHSAHSIIAYCKRIASAVFLIKPQCFYLICIIAVAMGGINIQNKRSVNVMTFIHGSLTGLSAAVAGGISRNAWIEMCLKSVGQHQNRVKMLGVPCGFAAGVIIGNLMGPGGVLLTGLAGLAGAAGATATTQILH